MTQQQFNELTVNDDVWYVSNTGAAGIFKHKYIGIFWNEIENADCHVFLVNSFVNVVYVLVGREMKSRLRDRLFLTENEAIEKQKKLREEGLQF